MAFKNPEEPFLEPPGQKTLLNSVARCDRLAPHIRLRSLFDNLKIMLGQRWHTAARAGPASTRRAVNLGCLQAQFWPVRDQKRLSSSKMSRAIAHSSRALAPCDAGPTAWAGWGEVSVRTSAGTGLGFSGRTCARIRMPRGGRALGPRISSTSFSRNESEASASGPRPFWRPAAARSAARRPAASRIGDECRPANSLLYHKSDRDFAAVAERTRLGRR